MSPSNQRSDAIKNREHIMNTAKVLFETHGVHETSMKLISTTAEIGQGTLYRHFNNKAALCKALIDDDVNNMFDDIYDFEASNNDHRSCLMYILKRFLILKEMNSDILEEMKLAGTRSALLMHVPFYHDLKEIVIKHIHALNIQNPELHTDLLLNSFSREVHDYYLFEKEYDTEAYIKHVFYIFIDNMIKDK